jgi:hypothetical protein
MDSGHALALTHQLRRSANWIRSNVMYFPHELRNAIPAWADSARLLRLTNVDGGCSHSVEFGREVHVNFRVEETGKLTGAFDVRAHLDVEAAKALSATLDELVRRVERMPPTKLF